MEGKPKLPTPAQSDTGTSRFHIVRAIQAAAPTRTARLFREILAWAFWLFVLVKLFVYDIDIYVARRFFPNEAWLLNYRFFILLCLAALIVLSFRSFAIFIWIAYVGFFPLIFLFWKFPRWCYRRGNWVLAIAALNGAVSFFRSVKYNVLVFAVGLTTFIIAIEATNRYLLWGAISALFTILVLTYIRRFISVFRPNLLFLLYTQGVVKNRERRMASYKLKDELRDLPITNLNEDQRKKWAASLEQPVLFNRFCLFIAKTLRAYQQSGMSFMFGVFSVFALLIATTFTFAVINLALFKINPENFSVIGNPSFFKFIYYSFNSFVFTAIKEIDPISTAAEATQMAERFLAIFLIGIFAASMISVRSQRNTEQLNAVIAGLEEDGRLTEGVIREEYRIENINAALSELERLKAGTTLLLGYLTKNLK